MAKFAIAWIHIQEGEVHQRIIVADNLDQAIGQISQLNVYATKLDEEKDEKYIDWREDYEDVFIEYCTENEMLVNIIEV